MTISYFHPDHIPAVLEEGDFVICTMRAWDQGLHFKLKKNYFAGAFIPEDWANDTKVMVIGPLEHGGRDIGEIVDALTKLYDLGNSGAEKYAADLMRNLGKTEAAV